MSLDFELKDNQLTAIMKRHQAHIARLMSDALSLMMYQTESTHSAHELQTALVVALGAARDAAQKLAAAIDPPPTPKEQEPDWNVNLASGVSGTL